VIRKKKFLKGDVMNELGQKLNKDELEEMFAKVDESGDGKVDFGEFLVMIADKIKDSNKAIEDTLMDAFRAFDKDSSGDMHIGELRKLMTSLGDSISVEDFDFLMADAELDEDGKFNYEEFIRLMISK
jgi:calmodulin